MSRGPLARAAAGIGGGLVAGVGALAWLASPQHWDEWLHVLRLLFAHDDVAQQRAWALLGQAIRQVSERSDTLILAAQAMAALGVLVLLPLLWRAVRRRRAAVFVSFHHSREPEAAAASAVLASAGFAVRRLPFDAAAGHQAVLMQMQALQRGAHALVCLPGDVPSVVDAEVYAAAVARQPVVFVLQRAGDTLPNAADKRYPMMNGEVTAGFGWAPLAELLHHVTGDLRSALGLYGRAFASPWLGLATAPLRALLVLAVLVLVASLLAHHAVDASGAAGSVALQKGQSLALSTGLLALVALPLLALGTALLLVLVQVVTQLLAARRASLEAGKAAFRRADWVGLIPGLEPGQPLYLSLLEEAPLAHHERPTKPAGPRRRAAARPR